MRVIVQGRLKSRSYETREGEKRTVFEIDVDEVGPSLRYATASVQRTQQGSGASFQRPTSPQQSQPQGRPAQQSVPARTASQSYVAPQGGGQFDFDEPPF